MLISCPECQKQISDRAAACPHCGNPLTPVETLPYRISVATEDDDAVTTEATGKRYKAMQLWGAALILAGMVACSVSASGPGGGFTTFLFIIGVILAIAGKLGAWWHHG